MDTEGTPALGAPADTAAVAELAAALPPDALVTTTANDAPALTVLGARLWRRCSWATSSGSWRASVPW